MQVCPNCGEENPDRFRLCGICGARLAAELPAQEVRRAVTIVYSDLKGSTTLGERLDAEMFREVLSQYFARMQAVLERHGGHIEKFIGDAIMAVFGLPRAHEDDALRAIRAAAEMQTTLEGLNEELELGWGVRLANRTGVNTGEVVAGDVAAGQRLVTGDVVNVAARLEQAAGDCEVLLGEPTYRLVRGAVQAERLEPLRLKGKADPVPAYRLISITKDEAITRRVDTPMVGRAGELELLVERFDLAVRSRSCQLVSVLGHAGVGKSRLILEFQRAMEDRATPLHGRCLPYGEGITFWPLSEIVHQAAGITQQDTPDEAVSKLSGLVGEEGEAISDRVGAAIGLSPDVFSMEEIFWGARKLIEALARQGPLLLFIEDLHWAEASFLDLVEHVMTFLDDSPVLLVCSSRPDLLEHRPGWGTGSSEARIELEPLSDVESESIVRNVLGDVQLPEAVRARIVHAAEGTPLFVEQMISMLIDEGMLVQGPDGQWTVAMDPSQFSVPPSIFALLAARLDGLPIEQRAILECASVTGHVFYRGAVRALAPKALLPHVGNALSELVRKKFIRPEDSNFVGEQAFRFDHALIGDVAYQGLLKRARADLHEGFADWLGRATGQRMTEYEEIVGYHLEQAFTYRIELSALTPAIRELGDRAAQLLSESGHRALARGDMGAAANLLERAVQLWAPDDERRLRLLPDLGEALMDIGAFTKANRWLEEATRAGERRGDRRLQTEASIVSLLFGHSTGPQLPEEELLRKAHEAVSVLEPEGDHAGLAKAWRLIVMVHGTACRYEAAEEAVRHAIDHARKAGDRRQELRMLPSYALAAMYGPMPASSALVRCHEIAELASGDRRAAAWCMAVLSVLTAMQRRFAAARDLYAKSRALFEELGQRLLASQVGLFSGRVEMLAGDFVAMERELRNDFEALTRMGEKYFIASVAPLLAEAVYLQGRYDEAEKFGYIARDAAAEDDIEAQSLWRQVVAKVRAREWRVEEAETLIGEALKVANETDGLELRANAMLDRAEILRLGGKDEEWRTWATRALELYEQKEDLASAERVRTILEGTSAKIG